MSTTTITAAPLINAKQASSSGASEYQSAASTNTIIDKFTAFNTDAAEITLTVWLIPSGGSNDDTNKIVSQTVSAGTASDVTMLQNQILGPGDSIFVKASTASKLVVRASGRKVTVT